MPPAKDADSDPVPAASLLGHRVVYLVHDDHRTVTVKHGQELQGSIHHPELVEFAGIVEREHDDLTYDIAIKVPNKPDWKTISNVKLGDEPGEFRKA